MSEDQKKKLKDRILTDLYNSGELQAKVAGICHRNFIAKDTLIYEDLVQETFYHLAKKSADFIIELHNDSPTRLVGLGVRIAVWKGVSKKKTNRDYPKMCLANYILFASNLQKSLSLSPTEEYCDADGNSHHFNQVLVDESTVEENATDDNHEDQMWTLIRSELTPEEIQTLDQHLSSKKGRGCHTKAFKDLKKRIEEIITTNQINF